MRNPDSQDDGEVRHNSEHLIPAELSAFMAALPRKIFEAAVWLRVYDADKDLHVLLDRAKRELIALEPLRNVSAWEYFCAENAVRNLNDKIRESGTAYQRGLEHTKFEDFTARELMEALRRVVFSDILFLQGKLKTYLDINRAQFGADDGIIASTKHSFQLDEGIVLVIGLSSDELALSFAVYHG